MAALSLLPSTHEGFRVEGLRVQGFRDFRAEGLGVQGS